MAQALGIGFRTYVRYESGERDAPAGTLVLIAKIGNVSLQNLLTRPLENHDIVPGRATASKVPVPVVKSLSLQEGTITFQKLSGKKRVALDESERKLLAGFRKLGIEGQQEFLRSIKKEFKWAGSKGRSQKKRQSPLVEKTPSVDLRSAAAIKPGRVKRRGETGRNKLDRKALREKISRLKSISRSAPKVTVR